MKVVFVEEVPGSALVGEVKEVKRGYARNFLLPRGLAVPATKDNLERGERLARADAIRQEKLDGVASVIAEKIDGAELSFTARVGEQGRLYGSITAAAIAERLGELADDSVDHRQVLLGQAIRTVGAQEVRVRLTRNVSATVTVTVAAEQEEPEEPAPEAPAPEQPEEESEEEPSGPAEAETEPAAADASDDADAETE